MERIERVLSASLRREFEQAVHDSRPVAGLTHLFYRYPARFSPNFAGAAIRAFTTPGDLVLDPFVGGGTTLVEARVLGRHAVGADISPLATFVARVKTQPLSKRDIERIADWSAGLPASLNVRSHAPPVLDVDRANQTNLLTRQAWVIRKLIALSMQQLDGLLTRRQRDFARCAILKTGQWALDGRHEIPTATQFRGELVDSVETMLKGIAEFTRAARRATSTYAIGQSPSTWCLTLSVADLARHPIWERLQPPKLILTSPPYPGVHVLYHRWQVRGRRETAAPFWITQSFDGQGPSHYTFANRTNDDGYFERALNSFRSLAQIAVPATVLVQLVGFSRPESQLPRFLQMMEAAGFSEVIHGASDRLWRSVPNRKWHADQKGSVASSREVVLIHRLRA